MLIASALIVAFVISCNQVSEPVEKAVVSVSNTGTKALSLGFQKLSEYGFFTGKLADLSPAEHVVPYDLNSPLFSDYAFKARFVKLPDGTAAQYDDKEVMDFPVGTVLIKNFYYPDDFRDATGSRKIMETRLLIHKETEGWVALPYIWNNEQTDAFLEVAGGKKEISWTHFDGSTKNITYTVPNMNQCKGCHARGNTMTPIGPKAHHLNGDFAYTDGKANQLQKWKDLGILEGLNDVASAPKVPVWDKPETGSLDARARAYLDINCGHCHNYEGPGNTSGLFLDYHEQDAGKLGLYKAPVAAGRGSGGFSWDIEPGHPERSILLFRMDSDDPGIMMPELGRKLIHTEGVELIREWIAALPADTNG